MKRFFKTNKLFFTTFLLFTIICIGIFAFYYICVNNFDITLPTIETTYFTMILKDINNFLQPFYLFFSRLFKDIIFLISEMLKNINLIVS